MFKTHFYKDKSIIAYSLLMTVFAVLFVSVELNNEKLYANDFRVYYEATKDFFSGNNPYVHSYGLDTGYFKYPPTTLLFFAPASWLSFSVVKMLHIILIYLSLIFALPLWQRLITRTFEIKAPNWLLSLAFFVIAIHLTREFHMGNVNVLLLVSFVLGAWFYHKSAYYTSSFFYGMMLILKPIMILAIVPIALYRNWKMIGLLIAWGLLFLLGPIFIWGWETNWNLWGGWVKSVTSHGEYISNPSSLQFLIPNLVGLPHSWFPSLIGFFLLLILWFKVDYKEPQNKKSFWFWTVVFLGFTPNFFVTDSQHFLLSIPTVMTLILFISNLKNKVGWILYCLGMLMFSFDSMDLWGRDLSNKFTDWGILGIGNLIFIASILYVWSKQKRIDATSHHL
jgi:hypothetical protein